MNTASVCRHLRYLTLPRPPAPELPVVLQFPVTDRCNSRCRMCNIWKNRTYDDISPGRLRRGLDNPLFSRVQSVGLNGGEPTLRDDLADLAGVLFETLPALKNVSLITNGYQYDRAIRRISEVADVVHAHRGKIDLMVSLDGTGAVHDRVRGRPGSFDRAGKVIDFARNDPRIDSLRIGCTIIRENVYDLENLLEFCRARGLYVKYRLGIPHPRLHTETVTEPYALTAEERYHAAEFLAGLCRHYEPDEAQRYFYRSLIGQMCENAPRIAGCDWQHRGVTISARGELLHCALQGKPLGLIDACDSKSVYFGNAGNLREMTAKACPGCRHDYTGLPPRRELLRRDLFRAARKLGLDPECGPLWRMLRAGRQRHAFVRRRRAMARLADRIVAQQKSRPTPAADPAAETRVTICGWYGTETLGDKAILGGILAAARARWPAARFRIASLHPYVTEMTRMQMPELKNVEICTTAQALEFLPRTDVLLFGGGPVMALPELAETEALFSAANRLGIETILAGCGVGPLGDPAQNASIKALLSAAGTRIYRDETSRDIAAGLGIDTTNDIVTEDPAFAYLSRHARGPGHGGRSGRRLLLGLREFPYEQYARSCSAHAARAMSRQYEHAVRNALCRLAERDETLVIVPLPMCTNHFGGDDRWFYRRLLAGDVTLKDRIDASLLGRERAPDAYITAFAEADAALVMRFHALVFSLALGLPAVAIDYTLGKGKVKALAYRFGVPQIRLDRITPDFLVSALGEQLKHPHPAATDFVPAFPAAFAAPGNGGCRQVRP